MSDNRSIAVSLGTAINENFSVKIQNVTGDAVSIRYNGISGNAPKDYQNFVAIWSGSMVNLSIAPIKKQFIGTNQQPGSVVMTDLDITTSSYTIAYGVGPEVTTICATALISAGGYSIPPTSVSVGLDSVTRNSISINYQTLPGYLPKEYSNWVGLWEGYAIPYNTSKPLAYTRIESNSSQGTVNLDNLAIKTKSDYTLVYFTGPPGSGSGPEIKTFTEAAALLYFNTGDYAVNEAGNEKKLQEIHASNKNKQDKNKLNVNKNHEIKQQED